MDAAGIGDNDDADNVATDNGGLYTSMRERERELRAAAEAEAAQMVAKLPQVEDMRNGGGDGVHHHHHHQQRQSPPSVSGGIGHLSPPSSAKSGMSPTPDVRLHHRAVVVAADRTEVGGALGGLVQQLTLDQFENEGRRVSRGGHEQSPSDHSTPRTSTPQWNAPRPRF